MKMGVSGGGGIDGFLSKIDSYMDGSMAQTIMEHENAKKEQAAAGVAGTSTQNSQTFNEKYGSSPGDQTGRGSAQPQLIQNQSGQRVGFVAPQSSNLLARLDSLLKKQTSGGAGG